MQLLEITDGTTTVEFLNMAGNYSLENEGWRPTVPNKRMSQLGGTGSYESVPEQIDLLVRPVTGGLTANEALVQLRLLMEQAERWGMGDTTVDPVRLRFQLEADAFPQENVIVGASGNAPIMTLPPQHVDLPLGTISHPVTLEFERRGDWLFYPEVAMPIVNSSFETFAAGNFNGWTKFGTPTLTQSTSHATQGSNTARVQVNSPDVYGIYQDVPLTNGVQYTISCDVFVTSGVGRIALYEYGSFTFLGLTDTTGTGAKTISRTATAAGGGIRIALLTDGSTSDLYFDAIMVNSGATADPWIPSIGSFIVESTAATIPSVHTLAWDTDAAGEGFDNPTDLGVLLQTGGDFSLTGLNSTVFSGVVALADAVNKIEVIAADTISYAAPWSLVSAVADDAFGGDVLRTDLVGTTGYKAVFASLDTMEVQVFATVMCTDTRIYGVRVIGATEDVGATVVGNTVYVEGSTVVSIVNLGKIRLAKTFIKNIALEVVSTSGTATGRIHFDTVLVMAVDSGTAALSMIRATNATTLGVINFMEAVLETGQLPEAYLANSRATLSVGNSISTYDGFPLQTFGSLANKFRTNTIYASVVAVPSATTKWRIVDTADDPIEAIFTATRAIANLLPN